MNLNINIVVIIALTLANIVLQSIVFYVLKTKFNKLKNEVKRAKFKTYIKNPNCHLSKKIINSKKPAEYIDEKLNEFGEIAPPSLSEIIK